MVLHYVKYSILLRAKKISFGTVTEAPEKIELASRQSHFTELASFTQTNFSIEQPLRRCQCAGRDARLGLLATEELAIVPLGVKQLSLHDAGLHVVPQYF